MEDINCIKCATCVENCPANILSLRTEEEAAELMKDISIKGYENRQEIKAKIIDIKDLTKDVKEFTFSFISPEKVDYKAGQFILIKIQDEPKAFRAYSISSFNEDSTKLSVIVKKVKKGYGTNIIFNDFKIGDIIDLEGPMGDELVIDNSAEKILFIGNGIGITPFIGLTKEVLTNNSSVKDVKLLDGQRYENEFLYRDYFESLDKEEDRFQYIPVVSQDKNSSIRKGYVTHILKDMDLEGYKVYICGSKNMVIDSYNILLNKGVKEEDIFYESEERISIKN